MKVELRTDKAGVIWATAVESTARYHLTCLTQEAAEALRVALNEWAEERKGGGK